jgi:hypothetical protein
LLNGARKMQIAQGINAINYSFRAKKSNYSGVYNVMAWYVKDAIEKGGVYKKALEEFIGSDRARSIDDFGSIAKHTFFMSVNLGMTQQEQQDLKESILRLENEGKLTRLDRFIIDNTKNRKEASLMLIAVEDKKNKEIAQQQQDAYQNSQQLKNMEMQTLLNAEQLKTSGKKEVLSLSGDITAQLMQLTDSLGYGKEQREAIIKRQLQGERLNSSAQKTDKQIQAKREMQLNEQTESLF